MEPHPAGAPQAPRGDRVKVARLYRFRASHSLPGVAGYDQPHEHDYTVEVVAEGSLDKDGMVIDTQLMDDLMEPLCHSLEDSDLNDFASPSTVENLADAFAAHAPDADQITVWEDDDRWGQAP